MQVPIVSASAKCVRFVLDATKYRYRGNHYERVIGEYTTSMFVTAMVTLAGPLPPNMPLTQVFPLAVTLFDGVNTITFPPAVTALITEFATGPDGAISQWYVRGVNEGPTHTYAIQTTSPLSPIGYAADIVYVDPGGAADIYGNPGAWSIAGTVPDAGSTLSLMTLTLMALGLVARRFKRAAA
jgi:hypothetical protein